MNLIRTINLGSPVTSLAYTGRRIGYNIYGSFTYFIRFVVGTQTGEIRVYDYDYNLRRTMTHGSRVNCILGPLSWDNNFISASNDDRIRVWHMDQTNHLRDLNHASDVNDIDYEGNNLISGGPSMNLLWWQNTGSTNYASPQTMTNTGDTIRSIQIFNKTSKIQFKKNRH